MLYIHYDLYLLLFTYIFCAICIHIYCTFIALVEPPYAFLLATKHPKAVGGVCHATNYQLHN